MLNYTNVIPGLVGLVVLTASVMSAQAQDAAVTDVFKNKLAVAKGQEVSVRHFDVPPGWATPEHFHTGHMFLYVLEGAGEMNTEGEVRTAGPGEIIHQLPDKTMVMRNGSDADRLKFIVFQVGPEGAPMIQPVK